MESQDRARRLEALRLGPFIDNVFCLSLIRMKGKAPKAGVAAGTWKFDIVRFEFDNV